MIRSPQRAAARRVIVGWQSSDAVEVSVEAATTLATATQAEVVGIYVENDVLIELADSPSVRTFGSAEAMKKPISRDAIITAYARGSALCRRTLSTQAGRAQVKWSYSTERGELTTKIRGVASAGDYIVLSGDIHGFGAKHLMDELRCSPIDVQGILITGRRHHASKTGPVVAIDDGDEKGKKTIELAVRIASTLQVGLTVFVVASTDIQADAVVQRANELASPGLEIGTLRLLPGSPQLIAAAARTLTPSFIVADRDGDPFGNEKSVLSLLRACQVPLLLLR